MADPNQCVLMPWNKAKSIHEAMFVKIRSLRVSVLKLQVLKIYHSSFFS